MIKEFWQERRDEKKRQKQLKKENRKLPKTKEQIAYKIFGVVFALFLVFGSIGYACRGYGDDIDYNWEKAMGLTDEMITALSAPVDRNLILTENVLGSSDWTMAMEQLEENNIHIVLDNAFDYDLISQQNGITSNVTFDTMSLGAIVYQLIEDIGSGEKTELLSFKLYEENSVLMLKTVCLLDLSAVVAQAKLPLVYVTTVSKISILDNSVSNLNDEVQINLIEKEMNDEIVNLLNKNSFLEVAYYTNAQVVSQINYFASILNANVKISGNNLMFLPKN